MPDHLRPPGLHIKLEPGSSGARGGDVESNTSSLSSRGSGAVSETPVSQAMRLAGVGGTMAGTPGSGRSKGSGGKGSGWKGSGLGGGAEGDGKGGNAEGGAEGAGAGEEGGDQEEGKDLPLDLGVKIFHHLNPAAQRDIMKQLIEKKLVEQYENMSIGGTTGEHNKDIVGDSGEMVTDKRPGSGNEASVQVGLSGGLSSGLPGVLPFNINADELDLTGILEGSGLGDLGDLIGPGNDAAIRTGFTPRGLMATPSGAAGGATRAAREHEKIMQVAVTAAAAAVGGGGMELDGDLGDGGEGGIDEFTSDVLKGLIK
jgi:hypothetical protein